MTQTYFIAGTDTGIGKTTVTCQLLKRYQQQGLRTLGFKPIASGCESTAQGWRNSDGLLLQAASSIALPYEQINPITLAPAIAPHIAAEQAGIQLSVAGIQPHYERLLAYQADVLCIEGCGGWLVPLNAEQTLADFVIAQRLPVILVVGMRLGCISHALLTVAAMQQQGVELHGWVANCLQPDMPVLRENIHTLQQQISAPLLFEQGVV